MRVNLNQTVYPTKLADLPCLTNILIQATAGTGTVFRIDSNKTDLNANVVPAIGLIIDPGNGIYSFCWKGELWAIPVGGTMFADVIING